MTAYNSNQRAKLHVMLKRAWLEPEISQLIRQAEGAGIEIAFVRRLHLGSIGSPQFGQVEIISMSRWRDEHR